MKTRFVKALSLLLAAGLQLMPMVRSLLPTVSKAAAPSVWAIIFRWGAGAAAFMGYHAISSASSIAITPSTATVGQLYVGTVTYSGGHAGSVLSMQLTNNCLGSAATLAPGLTITYSGGNQATVSGTPTSAGAIPFLLRMFDSANCTGAQNSDTRSTTLVINPSGGGGVSPTISAPPQNLTAQVGADALFSVGASGTPTPRYFWYQGLPSASTLVSTNSTLHFPAVQLTNGGLYTVIASNSTSPFTASATAYLSVVVTPGSNQLALNFTNYYPQGRALTMYSYLTNAPAGSNVYKWQYNFVDITAYSTNGNLLNLSAAQVTGAKSGTYSVVFNSVVGGTTVVNQQQYYSYWSFGTSPTIISGPVTTNVTVGTPVTLSVSAAGSNTLAYQWVFNTSNYLAGQTSSSLTFNPSDLTNSGVYTVVVTNYYGSITSAPATLTVASSVVAPGISAQPVPRAVLAGQNASFTVTATGSSPLSYLWKKDNVPLSNGGIYSGVLTNVLTLAGVGTNAAGNYSVAITNSAGTTNSAAVPLIVALPPSLNLNADGTQLSATTLTGLVYVVETTTNLGSSWVPSTTNVVPPGGQLGFSNSTSYPMQFFRLRFP